MARTRILLAALLVASVVTGAIAGTAAAATNGSITATPADPGTTSTHLATETVGSQATGSWNGFAVGYDAGDASNVSVEDIAKIGIDRGDDSSGDTIDVNVSDDVSSVSSSNNGKTLKITLGGSYELNDGDEVVVKYSDVVNPDSEGSYDVALDVNPQSSGGETAAALAVTTSSDTTTETTTTQTTTTQTTEQTSTQTTTETSATTTSDGSESGTTASAGGSTTTEESSSGGSPGFGVGVALAAFVGVALLARRGAN